jgi:serine protease AprX
MKTRKLSTVVTLMIICSLLLSVIAGGPFKVVAGAQTLTGTARVRDAERDEMKANSPALALYAADLTELAQRGALAPVKGYEDEIEHLIHLLARKDGKHPVLIGESSVERNIIVEGLAQRIASNEVPVALSHKSIMRLNLDAIAAQTKSSAEIDARLNALMAETEKAAGRIILFIDEIHQVVGAGATQETARIVSDALQRGRVRVVGATNSAAFEESIEQRSELARLFEQVRLEDAGKSASSEHESDAKEGLEFAGEKIAPDVSELMASAGNGADRVSLILQGDDLQDTAFRQFLKEHDGHITENFNRVGAQVVEVPARLIEKLADKVEVSHISLDRPVISLGHLSKTTGCDDVRNDEETSPTGVKTTTIIGGAGIGIAVIDSGIYAAHKAFLGRDGKSRIAFSKDFTGENRTDDPYGHGTHVASLAAGNGMIADASYVGIAPDAKIINLRVLNSQGTGTTSAVLNALNWVLSNRTTYNIRVVNLSLGGAAIESYKNDPVDRAVRALANVGVVVVAAAGNDGKDTLGRKVYGQIHSPGNEPSALTVGAVNTFGTDTRQDDGVATYSSRGPTRSYWTSNGVKHYDNLIKPDFVAPGNKLVGAESVSNALVRLNPNLDKNVSTSANANMMSLSGTSMAAPVVAGAAALLLQINPNLTPNMVKALLMYTAQPLNGFNMFEQGAGQVNISGAIQLAKIVRTDLNASTAIGTPVFTRTPPLPYTTISGFTFPWSQGIILNQTYATGYGLALYQKVYAQGVLLSDGVIVSNGVLLSNTTMMSSGVVLGDSVPTSNGQMMSSGKPFIGSGVLLGDGVMLSDGVILGDGVVLGDGVIISDGIMLSDTSSTKAMTTLFYGDNTSSMPVVRDNGINFMNY